MIEAFAVATKFWIVFGCARNLTGQLLKRFPLSLWDQKGSEDTTQHKECEDLQDMIQPWRRIGLRCTSNAEWTNQGLSNDGTDLARSGRDTMAGRPVPCREALAGNDEGRRIWAKVEEEIGDNVAREEASRADLVISKAHDAEEDGQDGETHELDWFAANGIDKSDRDPVTRNRSSTDKDDVTRGDVHIGLVDIVTGAVPNGCQYSGVV